MVMCNSFQKFCIKDEQVAGRIAEEGCGAKLVYFKMIIHIASLYR